MKGQKNKKLCLVIISGYPATGKTTLGKKLARALRLPFINKDTIKELLVDMIGYSDRAWSRKLGKASLAILFEFTDRLLSVGQGVIIENDFRPALENKRFKKLMNKHKFLPIQIFCHAEPAIIMQRFRQRVESGKRHPGHVDHLNYEELKLNLENKYVAPLEIGGELILIDTTDFKKVSHRPLIKKLKANLRK